MATIPGRHFVRNLVERRALVAQLVRRDFHQRYVGSAAGWLWGVANPLVQLGTYYFIFQVCLRIPTPEGAGDNYAMFLMAGFLPWMLFSETVMRSASSLVEHSNLITRTVFPSEVVPVSIFVSSLMHHLIGLVLLLGALLWTQGSLSPLFLLLPLYMVFVGLLGVGIGWIAASLHVYVRDTGQALAILMTLWFWATPIMISKELVPPNFHVLIDWNPMSWIVEGYRGRLLAGEWPQVPELALILGCSATVFVAGGMFFRHLKRGFADVL